MRSLIITAILVPVLVIVLGINITGDVSLGELIAILISVLLGSIAISTFVAQRTKPSRAYELTFYDNRSDFPPSYVYTKPFSKTATVQAARDYLAEILARVRLNQGVDISEIDFRLVNKRWLPKRPWPFPLWMWQSVRPSVERVFVTNLWDADWENDSSKNPHRLMRGRPLATVDDAGGYRLNFGHTRRLLARDSLWIRVIVDPRVDWSGYLEFQGPSADQRRAYSRRKVAISSNPDTED